jgi:uncharacterized protein
MDSKSNASLLTRSPHDAPEAELEPLEEDTRPKHWVPSRYNIRASAKDGRLILWNTLRGSMSVFKAEQAPQIVGMLKQQGFQAPKREMVKYLVDRGILIEKGTNEYRQLQLLHGQQQYRADVLQLILLSSEDCNFRCKYCYEKFERGTMHPLVRQGIKKMLDKRLPSLRHLHIDWFGGEPLYGMTALEDLGPWLVQAAEKHDVKLSSAMTTNGYLLTPDVVDKLLAWKVNHFQVTLDGPAERHDQSRPGRDGSATFDTIFNNLKAMARRTDDFGVMLRVNYDPSNYKDIPKLMDQVRAELGQDSRFKMHFHAVGRWGGDNDANLDVCGTNGFEIGAQLKAAAQERGFGFNSLRPHLNPGSQICYAARPYSLLIGATGKVMKCTVVLDTDERNVVGHIKPSGEMVLDPEKMTLWTEPAYERDEGCKKCVMLPGCQGISCPLVRMRTNESPCVPTKYHAKRQMVELLEAQKDTVKRVEVPVMMPR